MDGFLDIETDGHRDPMEALAWIAAEAPRGLYLLKDFDGMLDDRLLRRRLRDTAMKVRNAGKFIFLLQQNAELPDSIKPLAYIVVSLFPDEGEIRALVNGLLAKRSVGENLVERLIASLKGMSLTESEHLLRRLLDRHANLTEDFFQEVLDEKEQITRKEGILEFVPPDSTLDQLGGLDQLKEWVAERRTLYMPEARAQGLPRPRGVLLMGISGCGKSLATKVIAHEWKLPLFRLDMNLVFAGVHGSAEWIFHRALEAVESVAPAVLWIDEIEMGIAGYHEGETGANTRIFSTFLTWMQEHRADVFVAATANRINLLPAEILRKGRFDQVFFVDLPNEEERKEIMSIHLARNGLEASAYDLILLASATRGWNGAEIEQAVASARNIPLARTMEEQLKAIRSWARTRALPATRAIAPEM